MTSTSTDSPDFAAMVPAILAATIVGTVLSQLVSWELLSMWERTQPAMLQRHVSLLSFFGPIPFVITALWVLLVAFAWHSRPALRGDLSTTAGRLFGAIILGGIITLGIRFGLGHARLGGTMGQDRDLWLCSVARSLGIVWCISTLAPRSRPASSTGVRPQALARLAAASLLILPAVSYMRWYFTDKDAGWLMILGVIFLGVAALALCIGGAMAGAAVRTLSAES